MTLITKDFSSGQIRKVRFETRDNHLEISWENKSVTAYRPVPQEVVDRLCKAPNPATYFEDRIAEEYPKVTPRKKAGADDAAKKLSDLFGG